MWTWCGVERRPKRLTRQSFDTRFECAPMSRRIVPVGKGVLPGQFQQLVDEAARGVRAACGAGGNRHFVKAHAVPNQCDDFDQQSFGSGFGLLDDHGGADVAQNSRVLALFVSPRSRQWHEH